MADAAERGAELVEFIAKALVEDELNRHPAVGTSHDGREGALSSGELRSAGWITMGVLRGAGNESLVAGL